MKHCRGIFKTQSIISDGALYKNTLQKILNIFVKILCCMVWLASEYNSTLNRNLLKFAYISLKLFHMKLLIYLSWDGRVSFKHSLYVEFDQ